MQNRWKMRSRMSSVTTAPTTLPSSSIASRSSSATSSSPPPAGGSRMPSPSATWRRRRGCRGSARRCWRADRLRHCWRGGRGRSPARSSSRPSPVAALVRIAAAARLGSGRPRSHLVQTDEAGGRGAGARRGHVSVSIECRQDEVGLVGLVGPVRLGLGLDRVSRRLDPGGVDQLDRSGRRSRKPRSR